MFRYIFLRNNYLVFVSNWMNNHYWCTYAGFTVLILVQLEDEDRVLLLGAKVQLPIAQSGYLMGRTALCYWITQTTTRPSLLLVKGDRNDTYGPWNGLNALGTHKITICSVISEAQSSSVLILSLPPSGNASSKLLACRRSGRRTAPTGRYEAVTVLMFALKDTKS
jgi:hypothetical protein